MLPEPPNAFLLTRLLLLFHQRSLLTDSVTHTLQSKLFLAANRSVTLKPQQVKGTCVSPHLHVAIHDYWWWFLNPWSSWESGSLGSLCWKASGNSNLPKACCSYSQLLVWYQVCWDFKKDNPALPCRTSVLHRFSSPAQSATTDIKHKTMKSLLHCSAHGEASPCSLHSLPLPPLPVAQPHVPGWFSLHSSFCSFKSNYMGNVSDANLFKPEHTVKSAL